MSMISFPSRALSSYEWIILKAHLCPTKVRHRGKQCKALFFSWCVQCIKMLNSLHTFRMHGHPHTTQLKLNNRTGIKMAVQNLSAPADNPLQQQGIHMGMTDLFMYRGDSCTCPKQRQLRGRQEHRWSHCGTHRSN